MGGATVPARPSISANPKEWWAQRRRPPPFARLIWTAAPIQDRAFHAALAGGLWFPVLWLVQVMPKVAKSSRMPANMPRIRLDLVKCKPHEVCFSLSIYLILMRSTLLFVM